MKYRPKEITYPSTIAEFHIVTPAGVSAYISNDIKLARERLKDYPEGYKLVRVTTTKEDVTPTQKTDLETPRLSLVS